MKLPWLSYLIMIVVNSIFNRTIYLDSESFVEVCLVDRVFLSSLVSLVLVL